MTVTNKPKSNAPNDMEADIVAKARAQGSTWHNTSNRLLRE
jgi:hypothetical protein